MNEPFNRPIKEIITEHPKVGEILNEYGIGCVTCAVGTCPLGDIISIHNLPPQQGTALMRQIAAIIQPGLEDHQPVTTTAPPTPVKTAHRFSPPIQQLVDEHTVIKTFLSYVPDLAESIRNSVKLDRETILQAVSFIRNCADRFHHAKEEDILFGYVEPNHPVLHVMVEDHKTGRGYVQSILQGLENEDNTSIISALLNYRDLLLEHIKKEDEILYPWIDQRLSMQEVGELFERFSQVEREHGGDPFPQYKAFINSLT